VKLKSANSQSLTPALSSRLSHHQNLATISFRLPLFTLYLPTVIIVTMYPLMTCLLTFSAHFFHLSAAQNSPPAGRTPAGGAFYAADK